MQNFSPTKLLFSYLFCFWKHLIEMWNVALRWLKWRILVLCRCLLILWEVERITWFTYFFSFNLFCYFLFRVLQRWAVHVLQAEHNIWRYHHFTSLTRFFFSPNFPELIMIQCRALILFVAAGALQEALAALREAHQPDTAAMFILACREIHANIVSELGNSDDESSSSSKDKMFKLPGLDPENEDVIAVNEYYGQYQRKLVHLCMDSQPFSDWC